ncbi:MAG: hypothetical protein IPP55_14015 [Anaerolineales bacterium]|nr:hypothetical protein [Anaerolineales bacterium]
MSEYFDPAKYEGWVCADCNIPLQLSKVDVSYLGNSFPRGLTQMSQLRIGLNPEELALGKMAEVEKALEDK